MAKTLQFRRDTTANLASVTGAEGELFIDITKDTIVVMDGVTAGGFPLQRELVSNVNIKTVNGNSLLGSGDITIAGGGSYSNVQVATYLPTYTGNIANIRLGISGVLTFSDGTTQITAGSNYSNVQVATYLPTYAGSLQSSNVQTTTANIQSATTATSTATGALRVMGGIGVAGNAFVGSIYTNNYFYANGSPISFGGGGGGASVFNFAATNNITSCVSGTGGTGSNNFFVGASAGLSVTTGTNNTFLGNNAGRSMSTNSNNFFVGDRAGFSATGSRNVFIGAFAGCRNTGSNNNFIGDCAGRSAATSNSGAYNNFFGKNTGLSNGLGSHNNFFGLNAGQLNTSGCYNNYFGSGSGGFSTTGCYNNFFGRDSGNSNESGCNNNFFGQSAGANNSTGNNNILIGYNAGTNFTPSGLVNITTESNRIVLGNADHACAQIQIAWTVVSDCRDKCIFGAVPHGRGFLQNINPVEFAFKDRTTGNIVDPNGKRRYGFLAQEILSAEGDSPVIVSTEDPDKLQMTNDYLVPVLVNAVKELSAEIETLKNRILTLESK